MILPKRNDIVALTIRKKYYTTRLETQIISISERPNCYVIGHVPIDTRKGKYDSFNWPKESEPANKFGVIDIEILSLPNPKTGNVNLAGLINNPQFEVIRQT